MPTFDDSGYDFGDFAPAGDVSDFSGWDTIDFGDSYSDLSNLNLSDFGPSFGFDFDIFDPSGFGFGDFVDNYDFSNFDDVIRSLDPFEIDGLQGSRDEFSSFDAPRNYLTDSLVIPGQGFQAPVTSLYQAAGETAPSFAGEGLREPEIPGMTYMGGAQGIYAEVPTQYDDNGNRIPGSGGYVTQMGFIPYEATPVLGDPRSFINDPRVLGRPVFTTDEIRFPDGTVVKVDPRTGETTTTRGGGGGGGRGGNQQKGLMQQLQQIIDARRINMAKRAMPDLSSSSQGRGGAYTPLYGYAPAPLTQLDLGSISNIFPSENVIDRLSGQMPIRVAEGGSIEGHNPEFYSEGGSRYVRGDGDGTSDSVPAMLARGEYVIPADVVSSIGNGDNEAGAEIMDKFLSSVREHKRGAHPEDLPEDSKGPLAYLAEAKKNVRD